MNQVDQEAGLRVELDTHHCELNQRELAELEAAIEPIRDLVREFPAADLYVTVTYHEHTETFRVKTALALCGRTLVTGDLAGDLASSIDACARKLVRRVEQYKEELSNVEEREKFAKGTYQTVIPNREPDAAAIESAIARGDYATFRKETYMFEGDVRKRAGRWVQRYPEVNAKIGTDLMLADIVEEVFLNAFERFGERPEEVRMGEWLEQLIDPSIKLLVHHRDQEMQNIDFARTLLEDK